MNDRMRIGELTERAEVTPRTVRYYESIGLLPPGEREGHGQHYYTEETLARLQKIDQLKKLGLSLDEIRDVIDFYFPFVASPFCFDFRYSTSEFTVFGQIRIGVDLHLLDRFFARDVEHRAYVFSDDTGDL